ncbi:MAG: NTP transferase domain-containing protein, partial [Octadecabacter sp.]
MAVSLIILAAGKGTRMQSDLPKVLHEVAGGSLLVHAMKSGASLDPEHTVIVAGHGADAVEAAARDWSDDVHIALQTEQLGTGHAVMQARDALADFDGDVIVLYGDTPFISPETLESIVEARSRADIVVLGFEIYDRHKRYGRLIQADVDGYTDLVEIVEFKDATERQRDIMLCNSGVIAADAKTLFSLLDEVGND